jgi:hypothetical protein
LLPTHRNIHAAHMRCEYLVFITMPAADVPGETPGPPDASFPLRWRMPQVFASRCLSGCSLALRACAIVALPACLQGCIVQDIRDNLTTANRQLAGANTRIDATRSEIALTNARLSGVLSDLSTTNAKLLDTNSKLVDVQGGLTRVDTTNSSLGTLDSQLTQMQASLTRIDSHLASLRQTLSAVDGMIPFLDLGTGTSDTTALPLPPTATSTTGDASVGQSGGQSELQSAGQSAAATPNASPVTPQASSAAAGPSLAGVWVSAFAGSTDAWLLRSDGTFVIATSSPPVSTSEQRTPSASPKTTIVQGRWRVEMPQSSSPAAGAGTPARPQLVLMTSDATSLVARSTIEQQSARSLTLSTISTDTQAQGEPPLAPVGVASGLVVLRRP